jgi:hypothetical protein
MNKYGKKYNKLEDIAGENENACDFREDVADLVRYNLEEGNINMTLKELLGEIEKLPYFS